MQFNSNLKYMEDFTKLLQIKEYSYKTIKTCKNALNVFIQAFPDKDVATLSTEEIENFIDQKAIQEHISMSYQKSLVGAIKFFYNEQLRKNHSLNYLYPDRREYKLPEILSKKEIQAILANICNIKHKAIIAVIYGCGLRLGEVINLKANDINAKRNVIIIKQSNSQKERYVALSDNLLNPLRDYYEAYKPNIYLFEGRKGGMYAARSVQNIFKNACFGAKISKCASVYTLRHSYATHLLESGIDIKIIQKLLGHSRVKTTQIYTQVSNAKIQTIKSPLNDIDLNG